MRQELKGLVVWFPRHLATRCAKRRRFGSFSTTRDCALKTTRPSARCGPSLHHRAAACRGIAPALERDCSLARTPICAVQHLPATTPIRAALTQSTPIDTDIARPPDNVHCVDKRPTLTGKHRADSRTLAPPRASTREECEENGCPSSLYSCDLDADALPGIFRPPPS